MKLFSLNGDPIQFNLIDIEHDECLILEDLIKAAGGDVTDDEESIVKFTSKEAFGKVKYPRAKIYNVDFFLGCIQQEKIIDPEPYRLSSKIPGDEYHIEHLLYGRCACNRSDNVERIVAPNGSQPPTPMETDSQASVETDETMFSARNEPLSLLARESIDESQMVVTAADLKICAPTLAGGDAAKAESESHEKRPCNVEYELMVQPKMAALEREASRLAAAKESNVENRQLQRSLRTRTRRNQTARTGALREKNLIDSEDSDVGNVPGQDESVLVDSQSCETPKKMVAVEVLSSPEATASPKPQLSAQSDSTWIETKRSVPKVLSNVVIPLNRIKKLDKVPAPTEDSKLLNVCYKGLKAAPASLKNPGEPVLSKASKRKHSYEKFSDEAGTSKRNEKNGKRELLDDKKSARKSNRRKGERETSEDEAKAIHKTAKRQPQITYSNGDGRSRSKSKGWGVQESSEDEEEEEEDDDDDEEEREEEEEENSSKKNKDESAHKSTNSTRNKKGMRRLFNPRERQKSFKISRKDSSRSSKERINYLDSSDCSVNFSSDEQVPKKKRSRRKEVPSSGSSDLIISDDSEKEDNPRKQRNKDFNKPGPSGIPKVKKDFYSDDDDDESTDDNLNGKTRRYGRSEKAGDCKQIMAIKTEPYSTAGKSRGQVWRSQLTDKPAEMNIHIRHGPFTPGERNIMINYLVRTRTVNKAKGLVVWKSMIDDGFLKHRTPQSLQNHFKKVILPHIEDCSCLKAEDKEKFLLLRSEKNERFRK